MVAVWGFLDGRGLEILSAPRTLLVTAANIVAALIFVAGHAVRWPQTLIMLVAAAVGGFGGAHLGRRLPSSVIRRGTLLLTAGITIAFYIRAYVPFH